jgi:hypothetical protein
MSEFWRTNREFYQPNLKSSPDKVFGTHRTSMAHKIIHEPATSVRCASALRSGGGSPSHFCASVRMSARWPRLFPKA